MRDQSVGVNVTQAKVRYAADARRRYNADLNSTSGEGQARQGQGLLVQLLVLFRLFPPFVSVVRVLPDPPARRSAGLSKCLFPAASQHRLSTCGLHFQYRQARPANLIGMLTVAPSTAWPSLVSGFILKDRDSSSATWPNPEPAGVSARTRHSRTDPEAATMQE